MNLLMFWIRKINGSVVRQSQEQAKYTLLFVLVLLACLCSCGLPTYNTIPNAPEWTVNASNEFSLSCSLGTYMEKGIFLFYRLVNTNNSLIDKELETVRTEWSGLGTTSPQNFADNISHKYYYTAIGDGTDDSTGIALNNSNPTIYIGSKELNYGDAASDFTFTIQFVNNASSSGKDALYCSQNLNGATKRLELLRSVDLDNNVDRHFDPEILDELKGEDLGLISNTDGSWYLILVAVSYYFSDDFDSIYSVPAVITAAVDLEG